MTAVIASHELKVYLRSPFAWIAAALLQLVFGWLFLAAVEQFTQLQTNATHTVGLSAYLVVQFLAPASIVMMLATPLLCMNLIAAERHSGRYALLASSPVSASQIVCGKFIAAIVMQLCILLMSALLIGCLAFFINLDISHLGTAFFGLALFISLATALSIFYSSLTRHAVLAAFLSFATLLLLWLAAASSSTGFLAVLSPSAHLSSFMHGLLDSRDIAFFVCTAGVFLNLSIWRLSTYNTSLFATRSSGSAA